MKTEISTGVQSLNNIRIVELTPDDILRQTDYLKTAYELIVQHEPKYPDIKLWFNNKVLPGVLSEERAFYIGYQNNLPIASSVVKKGEDAKFCHLHINEQFRNKNIGDIFFLLMSVYVRRYAKRVHFSLPESLWEEKKEFFESFGFNKIKKYQTQYRNSENELTSSADFNLIWKNSLLKLPDLIRQFNPQVDNPLNGIIMSIQPKFLNRIINGEKVIELRKKFNKKWIGHKVTMYCTSPVQQLVGSVKIMDVIEDEPESIWQQYADKLGCNRSEFEDYTKGETKIAAIFVSPINDMYENLSLKNISACINKKISPPQSFCSVINSEWKNIISIAEMEHGRFNVFSQVL